MPVQFTILGPFRRVVRLLPGHLGDRKDGFSLFIAASKSFWNTVVLVRLEEYTRSASSFPEDKRPGVDGRTRIVPQLFIFRDPYLIVSIFVSNGAGLS